MKRAILAPLLAACLFAANARAEENGFANFFSHLFGGQPAPKPTDAAPAPRPSTAQAHKPKKKPDKKREASATPAPSATPPPEASKFVYVLGDSLAISAADGLSEDFEEKPEIGVVDRARDASGLVRDDYFDWPKAARDLVADKPAKDKEPKDKDAKDKDAKDKPAAEKQPAKEKVDYVVVLLGINDMQPMRDGKDYVDPLTDRWTAAYAQRIQAVVAPLSAAHVPVVWVGLPPMRSEKFNAQVVELNQIIKENAEKAGAKFVDIFDDFADQSGGFDAFGPNMEGQKVKLRSSDGIHLTAAGGKKLAHFLDEEILKALDERSSPTNGIASLPPDISKPADINDQIRREMGPEAPVATPAPVTTPEVAAPAPPPPKPEAGAVASLTARPASAGATLVASPTGSLSEAERILKLGEPPRAAPGRADDFTR